MPNVSVFNRKLFTFYCVLTCISTSALNFGNRTRLKRQADCGFTCTSGQCISEEFVCDGREDCPDGNDEKNFCKNLSCKDFFFRCNYGGCVPKTKICNRDKDCRDNSDEISCYTSGSTYCDKNQFQCRSSQCIASALVCNGLADCLDSSDESEAICSKIACPSYTFRCDYGACISSRGKCNGVRDCLDYSDENPRKCGATVPLLPAVVPVLPDDESCPLPVSPENGFWELAKKTKKPLTASLPESTVIYYKCNAGYKLAAHQVNISICLDNQWQPNLTPTCIRTCPSIESTDIVSVKCSLLGKDVNCLEPADGTTLNFTCTDFYEAIGSQKRLCKNGSWNLGRPNCIPRCGHVNNSTGGSPHGKYPWHAAIYKETGPHNEEYICGGTMINEIAILTAAHCVSGIPKEKLSVALGRYYSHGNHSSDDHAQFSKVLSVYIDDKYRGTKLRNFADIAFLVMEKSFTYSSYVQPICWDTSKEVQLYEGPLGVMAEWGPIQELSLPIAKLETCKKSLPATWESTYLSQPDKICAGYTNKKIRLCPGKTGSALVYQYPQDGRYYLQGILSGYDDNGRPNECVETNFAIFTNITEYTGFMLEVANKLNY